MTSNEIVLRTLDFSGPERVARSFGGSDFYWTGCRVKTHASDWREAGDGRWERTDEWGNLLARLDTTSNGEVVKGVLDDFSMLDSYESPDYSRSADYAAASAARVGVSKNYVNG